MVVNRKRTDGACSMPDWLFAMKALVKSKREPGLWLEDVPEPDDRHQRRADPRAAHRHLRHRPAHLQLGRMGAEDHPRADGDRPRVRRRDRRGRLERRRFLPRRYRQRRRPRGLRPLPQLPGGPPASVRAHQGVGREPARRVRRVHRAADDQHLAPHAKSIRWTSPPSSIPSATPCTRRCRFRCWAKTC